jgi:hypothetical protein
MRLRSISFAFLIISAILGSAGLAGELTLCREVRDLTPVEPTTQFPGGTKQIYAVFRLDAEERFEKLTSTWIAVDVGDAAPPNYSIASADTALKGQKTGKLSYTQPNPMPDGKYRVELLADGKPWKTVEFTIGAAPTTQPRK